ncbi:MAG: ADP-ribosyl-(dinitrogen reductase) hydrolase [Dehalococcoidia bacterium]|nr:ADP-ribosyl-(dinitrogen reductase) hydrolase [Dehalococcoidia bacterium]
MAIARLVYGEKDGLLINLGEKIEEPKTRKAVLDVANLKKSDLIPSGFVLDTLKCALWCFMNTDSLEAAIVEAVNLGGDADTVGAVCGALAGAYYGQEAIPQRWLELLSGRGEIEKLAIEICKLAQEDVL